MKAINTSAQIGTHCQICDSFIPIINVKDGYPRICDECKKRLKKLLYELPQEEQAWKKKLFS